MQSNSKLMSRLFTVLMRRTVLPGFVFPGGKVAERRVDACLGYLSLTFGTVGLERIVDFCICQVYAVSRFTPDYLLKWKLSHSFGERACVRFVTRKPGQKYYEDRWLKEHSLTREYLLGLIEDRQVHPLYQSYLGRAYETACRIDGSRLLYLCRFDIALDAFFCCLPDVPFFGCLPK